MYEKEIIGDLNHTAEIMELGMMNFNNGKCNWEGGMNGMMGYPGYYGMMRFGWMGPVIGGIFFIVLILIVVLLYKVLSKKFFESNNSNVSETHMDILKRRYASGEITQEQFENMSKKLKE